MLDFKFIDTLDIEELTGPVPIVGCYGGLDHKPNIILKNDIFRTSTITTLVGMVTNLYNNKANIGVDFNSDKLSSDLLNPAHRNLIQMSEDIIGGAGGVSGSTFQKWTVAGESGPDKLTLTYSNAVSGSSFPNESPLTDWPATILDVEGNTTLKSLSYDANLGGTAPTQGWYEYTLSMYVSNIDIGEHPNYDGGVTSIKTTYSPLVETAGAGPSPECTLIWKDDGRIQLTTAGCVRDGYEKIVVGETTWYRIWMTFAAQATGTSGDSITIYPTGYMDISGGTNTPIGTMLLAHPMLVRSSYITPYVPQIILDTDQTLTPYAFNNLLVGPKNANMVVPTFPNQTIYDAETNKPITEYTKGYNKIFIGADFYKEKNLVYVDSDNITKLVRAYPRFPYTHSDSATWSQDYKHIICPHYPPSTTLMARPNPFENFSIYMPIRNNSHSWKLNYKKSIEIVNGNVIKLRGGTPRNDTVWDEEPKKINNKLYQLSEMGLTQWIHDQTWLTNSGYYLKTIGDKNILLNYDIEIAGIDYELGRVLFEKDAPEDIKISYCLNDEWETIPVEFNPVIKNVIRDNQSIKYEVPDKVTLKVDPADGTIYYEINGNGQILQNGQSVNVEADSLSYERYENIATISIDYDKISLIDVRREGGMLIDKNEDLYNINSYTTWGFMGVNPTELNIAIVKVPDSALENLIYQLQEFQENYDPDNPFTFPLDWANNRMTYLTFMKDNPDAAPDFNFIKQELLTYVKRHMPAGVRVAITDKENNVIYYDYDTSIEYGEYL